MVQRLMTAVVAAMVFTVSLKGLHLFHLVKWNPIHFLQKVEKFEWTTFACWVVLFFILFAVAYVLLVIFQLPIFVSPLVVSLVFGLVMALVIEWQVRNLPIEWTSIKKLSVPFIVLLLISMRFLTETAYTIRK